MLKMENVKKEYQDFTLNCSLEVKEGYVTGLIGANGAGKSTAFKAALGLIRTDGGSIEVFDKNISEIQRTDREYLGVVLGEVGFVKELRIKDMISILSNLYTRFDRTRFEQLCQKFKLPLDKKIKNFSTGMRRKLQIITALTHDAKLLILDEPTAGLDVVARDEILELLREYMETVGRAILISSHISSDLENLCDDIYMINHGNVILHEDIDTLMDQYGLLKMTEEQYRSLDKTYIIRHKKESFGYSCLTTVRQFYQENYPEIAIEKGNIDEIIMMTVKGEK